MSTTKKSNLIARIILYVLGLLVLAFGVSFSINSDLGVSAVSTPPFIFSLIFDTGVGIWAIKLMLLFIIIQIIILRKQFKLIDLTQIIFSTIFGYFIDFAMFIIGDFRFYTYFGRLFMLIFSIILLTFGITMFIEAKLVNLPPEGFCVVVSQKYGFKFYKVKMLMDISLVFFGIISSLIFLDRLYGVREGTVISAIFVGRLIPYAKHILNPLLSKIIK